MSILCMRLYVNVFYKHDNSNIVDCKVFISKISINIRLSNMQTNLDLFLKEKGKRKYIDPFNLL